MPLVRQTWLARKKEQLRRPEAGRRRQPPAVSWRGRRPQRPAQSWASTRRAFSSRGRATCLVCGASVDADYVKAGGPGGADRRSTPLAAVLPQPSGRGRDYLAAGDYPLPSGEECAAVLADLDVAPPTEAIPAQDTRNFWTPITAMTRFRDLFTPRQLATLCAFAQGVREIHDEMIASGVEEERAAAICAYLGLAVDRVADFGSSLCRWVPETDGCRTRRPPGPSDGLGLRESEPVRRASGDVMRLRRADRAHRRARRQGRAAERRVPPDAPRRSFPSHDATFDAVITDPPYYDNISYADLSDFFYVWLKRSVGFLFPEHLGGELTPKRREAIVAPYRHDGEQGGGARVLRAGDGGRLPRGPPGAQAERAAGLRLRPQDDARLGVPRRGAATGGVHDHRGVAARHRDAGALDRPGHAPRWPRRSSSSRGGASGEEVGDHAEVRARARRRSSPSGWTG